MYCIEFHQSIHQFKYSKGNVSAHFTTIWLHDYIFILFWIINIHDNYIFHSIDTILSFTLLQSWYFSPKHVWECIIGEPTMVLAPSYTMICLGQLFYYLCYKILVWHDTVVCQYDKLYGARLVVQPHMYPWLICITFKMPFLDVIVVWHRFTGSYYWFFAICFNML